MFGDETIGFPEDFVLGVHPACNGGKVTDDVIGGITNGIVEGSFGEVAGEEVITKDINVFLAPVMWALNWFGENGEPKLALEGRGEGLVAQSVVLVGAIKGVKR
jgi:hypothetical protein